MDREDSGNCNTARVCGQVQVPTDDELEALNALREIKKRVNDIKQVLSDNNLIEGDNVERAVLERELLILKKEWMAWVEKKEEAARERMILLGHEKP